MAFGFPSPCKAVLLLAEGVSTWIILKKKKKVSQSLNYRYKWLSFPCTENIVVCISKKLGITDLYGPGESLKWMRVGIALRTKSSVSVEI